MTRNTRKKWHKCLNYRHLLYENSHHFLFLYCVSFSLSLCSQQFPRWDHYTFCENWSLLANEKISEQLALDNQRAKISLNVYFLAKLRWWIWRLPHVSLPSPVPRSLEGGKLWNTLSVVATSNFPSPGLHSRGRCKSLVKTHMHPLQHIPNRTHTWTWRWELYSLSICLVWHKSLT